MEMSFKRSFRGFMMRELVEILIQKKQKTRYGICGDKTLRDVCRYISQLEN